MENTDAQPPSIPVYTVRGGLSAVAAKHVEVGTMHASGCMHSPMRTFNGLRLADFRPMTALARVSRKVFVGER